ncbi:MULTISPECIES: MaoC/PaaZ C-terminal domain-containing protein [unclassified Caballeronia]|uniref:MaoC family dehydratase n=1 Tax=unclassified Caballeronia TaxID=2646786 RepID=UPI00285B8D57|nr:MULTISPECIES: MaoC/PaaZ C-terminal domain-containing protein [unclassified Caballeronia]MDR5818622.1 MaoC/PaaZ C-terminal domain-containing protein [Caballeronia sp. LZ033]MDR5884020.1 MaoC/PaaZ C-terminal domain-containing protein [Caballeronia sp. LZ032]
MEVRQDTDAIAQGRALAPGMYDLSDIEAGDHFATSGMTVTETHVVNFAGVSGDLYDLHLDDVAAQEAGFPGRIAHGLLGLALADGLKTRCAVRLKGLATLSWNWSFRAPLMIGDRIHVEVEVVAKRPTKRADRGIATLRLKVLNQAREVVQDGETLLLMANRT